MPAIDDYDSEGVLTIAGFSMNRPAWAVLGDESGLGGLLPLVYKVSKSGEPRLIPGAAGVIWYPLRKRNIQHPLRLAVTGDVDSTGATNADSRAGLAANLRAIYTNVIDQSDQMAATLVMYGVTYTFGMQVHDLIEDHYNLKADSSIWTGTMRIEIAAGRVAVAP